MRAGAVAALFFLLYDLSEALRDVRAVVPLAVPAGAAATLRCVFDLEGEPLYTVKWYRGPSEFYRYVPKEMPSTRVFALPGLRVDLGKSTPNEVVLRNVLPDVSGRYKCEVSTDAPNFYTQIVSGYMHVVEIPDEGPSLTADKEVLEYGYAIRGNCTTPPSYPPMNVTWYLNGQKINEDHMRRKPNAAVDEVGLKNVSGSAKLPRPTVSLLEVEIDERKFVEGILRVECVATLFDVYARMARLILGTTGRPRPSSVLLGAPPAADAPPVKSFENVHALLLPAVLMAGIVR